jgi:hypothetical protein
MTQTLVVAYCVALAASLAAAILARPWGLVAFALVCALGIALAFRSDKSQ